MECGVKWGVGACGGATTCVTVTVTMGLGAFTDTDISFDKFIPDFGNNNSKKTKDPKHLGLIESTRTS